MIRVVLDTNIVIAALLTPHGLPAQAFQICLNESDVELCVSADIYAEFEEVVRRPKFKRSETEIMAILKAIRENAVWIRPSEKIQACSDPDDDMFLECTQAAGAHYLVTGNLRHFPSRWDQVQVVSARHFIDEMFGH